MIFQCTFIVNKNLAIYKHKRVCRLDAHSTISLCLLHLWSRHTQQLHTHTAALYSVGRATALEIKEAKRVLTDTSEELTRARALLARQERGSQLTEPLQNGIDAFVLKEAKEKEALKKLRATRVVNKERDELTEAQELLKKAPGPFMRRFSRARKAAGWSQNPYYAGSMNGNDCKQFTKNREELFHIFDDMDTVDLKGNKTQSVSCCCTLCRKQATFAHCKTRRLHDTSFVS